MAFCQFCGKEVKEGEVCGCKIEREVMVEDKQEVPASAITETHSEPAFSEYGSEGGAVIEKPKDTKVIVAFAAAAAVIVIAAIIILIAAAGGGYKKPVKDFVKAFNECDGKLLTDTIATEKMIKYLDKEADMDYDDMCDEMEGMIDEILEEWEEDYGDDLRLSVKFEDKDELDKDDIEELEDYYKEQHNIKVKIEKAYELECVMTLVGEDDDDDEDVNMIVIKVRDEGWKLFIGSLNEIVYDTVL